MFTTQKFGIFTLLILVTSTLHSQPLPHFNSFGNKLNSSQNRKVRMDKVLIMFAAVMNDSEFQKELLSKTFIFDVEDDPNRNLSTAEVVKKIYNGIEWYNSILDNTANIYWEIEIESKPRRQKYPAIGYGYPNDTTIYTYSWFFDDNDNLPELVGHVAHEWSHKAGFEHLFEPHDGRENTVPYAFGDLVAKYADRYIRPHRPHTYAAKKQTIYKHSKKDIEVYKVPCSLVSKL